MKTRNSTWRMAYAKHVSAVGLLLFCSNILLWTDTAYCKMQQSGLDIAADPFADTPSSPFDDPFKSSDNQLNSKAKETQPTGNPTTATANVSITKSFNEGQSDSKTTHEKILDAARQAQQISRPVWPERSQPGGLVSSSCIDPLMSGKQEALLWERILAIDDVHWDTTLSRLVDQLNQSLPVHLDRAGLKEEGVDPDNRLEAVRTTAPLAAKLELILKPLNLTYICRAGQVVITTEANVDDGAGVLRIYDVSTLVDGLRDGMLQLTHNINQSIEPDSWLENGGSSTICPHIVADGAAAVSTLIIGAETTTHLRIQTMLDRLNQLTSNSRSRLEPTRRMFSSPTADSMKPYKHPPFDDRVMSRGGF
jgi:hypothetical protein